VVRLAIRGEHLLIRRKASTQIPGMIQRATKAGKSRVLRTREKQASAPQHSRMFASGVCQHAIGTVTVHQVGVALRDSKGPWVCVNGDQHIQCVDAPVVKWSSGLCGGTATERDTFTRTAVMIEASLA